MAPVRWLPVGWLLGLTLGMWLAAARAHAEPPACVELALPEQLPQRAAWNTLLLQETRPLLAGEGGPCAQIEVQENDAGDARALQVSWAGASRVLPLMLEDLPEGQRPRAAALLAHGLLQQLVGEPPAETAPAPPAPLTNDESALPAWDQATDSPSSASQLSPPRPTPRRSKRTPWDDYRWQPGPEARDQFASPARRHGSRWSGAASSGGGLALTSLTPLLQLELAAQRQLDVARMRLGIGLLALLSPSRVFVGGPGARGSVDFLVTQSRYARLWLGPGFSFTVLVLQVYDNESLYSTNMVRSVAAADVRASVDIAVSRRAYLTLALEFAYPLRYLRVISGDETLFAYAGPLLGLRVGVGF
jgi:hypothetical protein